MTTTPQDELLARFSKEIDLPAYLVQRGYEVVADAKNAAYIAMAQKSSGQILLIAREADRRGWTYKSATDPRDRARARGDRGHPLARAVSFRLGKGLNRAPV